MSELEEIEARAAEIHGDHHVTVGVALSEYRSLLDRAIAIATGSQHEQELLRIDLTVTRRERDEARAAAERMGERAPLAAYEQVMTERDEARAAVDLQLTMLKNKQRELRKAHAAVLALRDMVFRNAWHERDKILADTEWIEQYR